jgi:sulfide:quinone oxidoreductase
MPATEPLKVVIAGGGVAAVEAALALHALAGDRVRLTLVAPQPDFVLRALRTAEPFAVDHVRRRPLAALVARVGGALVRDAAAAVDGDARRLRLAGGGSVDYDALVVATGAERREVFPRALTFIGDRPPVAFSALLADLEEGWSRSAAFVAPPATTWTLPLYELALMTAAHVHAMGLHARLEVITAERAPLALFGTRNSAAVAALLSRAEITFRGGVELVAADDGRPAIAPEGTRIAAERIVALPAVEGRPLPGLPADERGFIPVDDAGRVDGFDDVYAAGDGTTSPIKSGSVACQLADTVAASIAAHAGARVQREPFRPVLHGTLLTPAGATVLEHPLHPDDRPAVAPAPGLWVPADKVVGRYLSAWLAEPEDVGTGAALLAGRPGDVREP